MFRSAAVSLISILGLVLVSGRVQGQTFNETFVYDERVHDFGNIQEKDGKVSHTFTFTNRGKEPVLISDVRLWCGCTEAQYSKQPVKPGHTTKVTLVFDPAYRPGKFSKEAVVVLNGGESYTRIWVKGQVEAMPHPVTEDHPYHLGENLYVSHQVIPFGKIKPGETDSIRVLIANGGNQEMTVEFIRQPDNKVLQMPRKMVLKPGERKKFYARYQARYVYDYKRQIKIVPVVNGKKANPLRITWLPNK